ncbi:MAG: hypothetical protein GTO41_07495 [Burkholderiales bacterium]|nr:hypothetical protein [Burkholderiales bacterium]
MVEPSVTCRLAVIAAADVEGYSRQMGDDEKATVQTLTDYRRVFVEQVGHAGELNPFYPPWYHNGGFHDADRKWDFGNAAEIARRAKLTDWVQEQAQIVAALGRLGCANEAEPYIERIYELDASSDAQKHWHPSFRCQPEYL